jgi:arylsulfatase
MQLDNNWSEQEAGMAQLDDIVGSVMKYLKDNGIEGAIILGFTTDNGAENFTWPDGGQTPLPAAGRRSKAASVPMILRWPGKVPAGKWRTALSPGWTGFRRSSQRPAIRTLLRSQAGQAARWPFGASDGYNQMDLITGKGPSARHEIFTSRKALAAVRIDTSSIGSPISRKAGWAARSRWTGQSSPTSASIRTSARVCQMAPMDL